MKTLVVIGLVVLVGGTAALGVAGASSAVDSAYARGKAAGAVVSKVELKASFDKGKKAGVEYESWFCANPDIAANLGKR